MPAPRIDQATVERMLLAYIKDPNPTHVAKTCGISWQTAKKYIQEGDPRLGIGPFATEARRILRAGDKIVRLTQVTKQIRVQVEEKDLAALQDMLFAFEATIHEGMALARIRMAREMEYYVKIDEARASGAPEEMVGKIPKPSGARISDLKAVAAAIHEMASLKREFWDRMEVVSSTEVEHRVDGEEGIADPPQPELDFEGWEPHEIAAYIDSMEDGGPPVLPAWLNESQEATIQQEGKSAAPIAEKKPESPQSPTDLVVFPRGVDGDDG